MSTIYTTYKTFIICENCKKFTTVDKDNIYLYKCTNCYSSKSYKMMCEKCFGQGITSRCENVSENRFLCKFCNSDYRIK